MLSKTKNSGIKKFNKNNPNSTKKMEMMNQLYHTHEQLSPFQCTSHVTQTIDAPLELLWSMVSRFDKPESYKSFVKSCCMLKGDGKSVGSIREVCIISGVLAELSIERLEVIDDEMHVMSFSVLGGDHRLVNYRSTVSLHDDDDEGKSTVVIESYVVDVPDGNTEAETKFFTDTIIKCNLKALAEITEKVAAANDNYYSNN